MMKFFESLYKGFETEH